MRCDDCLFAQAFCGSVYGNVLAKRKGKKVIVVSEIECLSPWIILHSDIIVKRFEEFKGALKGLL